MSRIGAKNSAPEMKLRRLVHAMGFRFRLHGKDLPGKPDLVFRSRRAAIFMHGCFWHRHDGCKLARLPKSKLDFWKTKLEGNKKRDAEHHVQLEALGWRWLIVWECQLHDEENVRQMVREFLTATEEAHQ